MRKGELRTAGVVGLILLAGAVLTGGVPGAGQPDQTKGGKGASKTEPPTAYKVEKKLLKVELEVKGTLEAEKVVEIAYRPQPGGGSPFSGPLKVQKAVPHGAKVAKGDVLLAFDTVGIDQVIDKLEAEKKALDAKVKLAEEEIPILKQSVPVELAEAEQGSKQADEDLKYFLKVGRPEKEKQAHFNVKRAKFWLDSEKEDLRQLEKMYNSKDLTEETEKIILKRQKFIVELAEFWLTEAEIERDLILQVTLPHDRDASSRQLDNLKKDRQAMTIQTPVAGIVYYGKFGQGKWTAAAEMADKLVPYGTIAAEQVLMTIVAPRPVLVRLLVDEKYVHLLKPDVKGKARVPFHPDLKLPARITRVSPLPSEPGKFEVLVSLDLNQDATDLMPGMACSVKFVPNVKQDALMTLNCCRRPVNS